MSKRSSVLESLPPALQAQLRDLGENLSVARKRRRESRKAWAERIGVSEPTLMRMEKGDASVSMAVYATALWLMGRAPALSALAAPEHDLGALEEAVRVAKTRATRKPVSIYLAGQLAQTLPNEVTPSRGIVGSQLRASARAGAAAAAAGPAAGPAPGAGWELDTESSAPAHAKSSSARRKP